MGMCRPKEKKIRDNGKLLKNSLVFFTPPCSPKQTIMNIIFNDEYRIFVIRSQHELVNSFIS